MLTFATTMAIVDVTQPPPQGQKAILLFWAPWNDASKPGGTMDRVLSALVDAAPPSSGKNNMVFGRVQAEDDSGVSCASTFLTTVCDAPAELASMMDPAWNRTSGPSCDRS